MILDKRRAGWLSSATWGARWRAARANGGQFRPIKLFALLIHGEDALFGLEKIAKGEWRCRAVTSANTIERFLGSAGSRFFGSGYRRVEQRLSEIVIERPEDGQGEINAMAAVRYPTDWSRKAGTQGDLPPHLSTIDAIVLAARLAEIYLSCVYVLDAPARAAMWLREVVIKAGAGPDEDGLAELPVSAKAWPESRGVTRVDCRIGQMRVRCVVEHEIGEPAPGRHEFGTAAEILAPDAFRPFGDGYRFRHTDVGELRVDFAALAIEGRAETRLLPGAAVAIDGLEAAYHPSVTMIEAFVTGLQLGQILLYELDGVPRGESNTLWMRRTVLRAASPARPADDYRVTMSLRNPRLLDGRGHRWRTADIVGDFAGIHLSCSVTHRL